MKVKIMFTKLQIISLLLGLALYPACNKNVQVKKTGKEPAFRVLGYLPASRDWLAGLEQIDLSKITDLNLAFINPDSSGLFRENEDYLEIVRRAHARRVRVFISIGGGSPLAYLETLMEKEHRTTMISSLTGMAVKYKFDGVDVDLENDLINANYAPFVRELSSSLKRNNLLMTAALASWNGHLIADSTLQLYDFINIMSYDKTGPWNLSRPGPHSPYSMVEQDFVYYNQTRKIPAQKLLIGLPFYGYGFGPGVPQSKSYQEIVNLYPGAESTDSITVPEGGKVYYNGKATIRDKVLFAHRNGARGVMIWQLLGDSRDSRSLLQVIQGAISR
ncbi:MAG TPA: glycosyl hydrolase family 18 protein [Saprospiraceae bacterium]|nr:glycosyl hydrolase family 18 protein [Saprospiraceae bacterium]